MTQSPSGPPGREEVVAILAKLGDRTPDEVTDDIGSLELAWLISEVEQRYGVTLELSDGAMAQMLTVPGAVITLSRLLTGASDG
jgi:acyl carrier protein